MLKTQNEVRLNWWPSLHDYNEAVQIPQAYLSHDDLKRGQVYTDAIGLPRPVTGSFASVYRMQCGQKDFALRLFLKNIVDQEHRYELISNFVQHDDLPYTITFDFLKKGIKIRQDWFPALKMDWVEGMSLDDYIVEHLADSRKLSELAKKFGTMMVAMHRAGIAHGDLQHGNIIVSNEELRLVDYDGLFVPGMEGYLANELGHRNYQHPSRQAKHFGPYLDNFSAWTIYVSIKALEKEPKLLHQLGGGDDCLLFRQSDFSDPINSAAFAALERHADKELQTLSRFIRAQLAKDLPEIPFLANVADLSSVTESGGLQSVSDSVGTLRDGPRLIRGTLPEWLDDQNRKALHGASIHNTRKADATPAKTADPFLIVPQSSAPLAWVKPSANVPPRSLQDVLKQAAPPLHSTQPTANKFASAIAALPPELSASNPPPRKVSYYDNSGKNNPKSLQYAMLLNPLVWFMLGISFTAFGVDDELKLHGVDYEAHILNVQRWESKGKHTKVAYQFQVDGFPMQQAEETFDDDQNYYRVGMISRVVALPSNPNEHEPLDREPGTQQGTHEGWAIILLMLNLVLELMIWIPANSHKRLARIGIPVSATIENILVDTGPKGEKSYRAQTSSMRGSVRYENMISINESQYIRLRAGTAEVLLVDPFDSQNVVFYKFCAYHPI